MFELVQSVGGGEGELEVKKCVSGDGEDGGADCEASAPPPGGWCQ